MKFDVGVPALVNCSVTAMRSVAAPAGRMSPHSVQNDEKPASTRTRLESGAEYVACMILAGASQIVPDSGEVVGTPGPMPGPAAVQPSPGLRHCPPSAVTDDAEQFFV